MASGRLARLGVLLLALSLSVPLFAADTAALQPAGNDLGDRVSLQRGAKLFMNYCSGCHSLKYLRYSRMAADLGLSEREVMDNLNFTDASIGDPIGVAMPADAAATWFGKAPPDLSLSARVRGTDWIYSYLHSFYLDASRPLGWNNTVFANASMPNPLWELQGMQRPDYGAADAITGERPVIALKLAQPGRQTLIEFDQSVRDIANFLQYAAEPAALERRSLGVWVVLFLALLTVLTYLLKREFWKDVE